MTNKQSTNSGANRRKEANVLAKEYHTDNIDELSRRFSLCVAVTMLDWLGAQFINQPHTWRDDVFLMDEIRKTAELTPAEMATREKQLIRDVSSAVVRMQKRGQT